MSTSVNIDLLLAATILEILSQLDTNEAESAEMELRQKINEAVYGERKAA